MAEDYWDRKRRHLTEDHAARRAESKRTMGLIGSQAEVDRLAAATRGSSGREPGQEPEFSETFRRLGVEWIMKKTTIMKEISTSESVSAELKAEWLQVLQDSTLTDSDDTALEAMRGRMFREGRTLGQDLARSGVMIGLFVSVSALIETRVQARAEF